MEVRNGEISVSKQGCPADQKNEKQQKMVEERTVENVTILDHPLIQHKISMIRNKETGTNEFRKLIEDIAVLMGYEALRDLSLEDVEVETPIEKCMTPMLSGKKLAIVPVLRAGLGMVNGLTTLVPSAKIGHIGLTAHSTAVFERALELDWAETIMFPYNLVEQQGAELIHRCAEKNIGFIDMKPLAGGAIEDGTLALRYVCSNPDVTVVIPGMAESSELEENMAACSNEAPLTEEELAKMEAVRKQLGTDFCRRCNYCAPCSVGINIPSVFLFAGYLQRYDLGDWARDRYSTLKVKASECIGCGKCEPRCPYHLPIREKLRQCAKDFGEI